MVKVQKKVTGINTLVRGLSRVGNEGNNFKVPLYIIAQSFFKINETNFEAQGRPKRFVALSPKYKSWKDKNYPGKKIMQLTDRLKNSLTAENQMDSQDTIMIITSKYADLGTNVPYAAAHQFGYPKRNLPKREIIQVTEKHKQEWVRIVQRWSFGLFRGGPFEVSEETTGGTI